MSAPRECQRALGLTTRVPARPSPTIAGTVPTSVPGVTVSKHNNMSRRNLRYAEIALVELLRGDWERTVDDGWPALVSATAAAARRGYIDIRAVGEAIRGERFPTARHNYTRLVSEASVSGALARSTGA